MVTNTSIWSIGVVESFSHRRKTISTHSIYLLIKNLLIAAPWKRFVTLSSNTTSSIWRDRSLFLIEWSIWLIAVIHQWIWGYCIIWIDAASSHFLYQSAKVVTIALGLVVKSICQPYSSILRLRWIFWAESWRILFFCVRVLSFFDRKTIPSLVMVISLLHIVQSLMMISNRCCNLMLLASGTCSREQSLSSLWRILAAVNFILRGSYSRLPWEPLLMIVKWDIRFRLIYSIHLRFFDIVPRQVTVWKRKEKIQVALTIHFGIFNGRISRCFASQ